MKNFVKILAVTAATTTFAATASAGDKDETIAFKYDRSAPVEVTYDRIQKQAVKACVDLYREYAGYAARKCSVRYMDDALAQIGAPKLIALHLEKTQGVKRVSITKLAQADTSETAGN